MSRNLLFICNPHAGKSGIRHNLPEILDVFIKAGYRVEIHLTQAVGDATNVAAERGTQFSRIVCGGGDGTLNETVSGLMRIPQELRPSLGFIPAGTQNDFARNLGIPFVYTQAAAIACGEETHMIDVGKVNSGFFNYVCGFGAFTEVSYETRQDIKKLLGIPAYGIEAVKSIMHLKPYHLTVSFNGRELTDDFMIILVGNSMSIGGMKGLLGEKIVVDDGLFEVFMVTNPSGISGWNDVLGNVFQDHGENPTVRRFKTSQIEFFSEEKLKWVKDGEYAGDLNYVKITNEHKALELAYRK